MKGLMPWTTADVDHHKKGLNPEQKTRWVAIANSVLADKGDEGMAIRIANSKCCESNGDVHEHLTLRNLIVSWLLKT